MSVKTPYFALFILFMPVFARAGKPQPDVPVQVEFRNAATDRITSDGDPLYVNGDRVDTYLDASDGFLVFRGCSSSRKNPCVPRQLHLDFAQSAVDVLGDAALPGPTALGLPFDASSIKAGFVLNPINENATPLSGGMLAITTPGEQRLGRLKVNFRDSADTLYTIRYKPLAPEQAAGSALPDSDWVLITFLGGSFDCQGTGDCAAWTVESLNGTFTDPSSLCCPETELQDIGTLLSENVNDEGDYHLPFQMTVTVLPAVADSGSGTGGGKGKH